MFKRVEKRRRKLEQDEELDLDQDMAEILGNPETDSDESDSSESDDTSGNESEAEAELDREADAVQVNEPIGYDSSSEDEGENGLELPLISVRDALNNPLYPISKQSQVMCVVCPGKLLKNTNMALVHTASSAHIRRFKHFSEMACNDLDGNAWDFIPKTKPITSAGAPSTGETSKRAEKRKVKMAAIKAKRTLQKVMKAKARARKEKKTTEASHEPTEGLKPSKKKRLDPPDSNRRPEAAQMAGKKIERRESPTHPTKSFKRQKVEKLRPSNDFGESNVVRKKSKRSTKSLAVKKKQ